MTDQAANVTAKLEEIGKRVSSLDDRAKDLEEIDKRIQALKDSARQAEQTTQKAIGPDGELGKHREAVQQLSSQALQTHATIDTLKKERASLEELRVKLHESQHEVKQATTQAGTRKGEPHQTRASATSLTQDYAKIRETSREAREDTTAALSSVKEIQKKLEPLTQLHELSQSTADRLASLNALSEHVTRKAKALESQQQAVEHAVVQSNRVSEMVWSMDAQMAKLYDGLKQTAKAEETIGRIEKLSAETAQHMEGATKLNQEVQRETAKLQKDSSQLLEAVRTEVGTLTISKREFDAFDERVKALQASVTDTEVRVENVAAKDKNLMALSQRVDSLTKHFETLFVQADELTQKQSSLETLHGVFAQVDELSKKAAWQMETMKQSRLDLEVLRTDVQDFYKSHAEIAKLRDKLGSDRQALEVFGERMAAMAARAPELDAKMDAILGKMALVEEGTQKATRLNEAVAELDTQFSRVTARIPFVEKLESRLNGLNAFSTDVDQKLEAQLARAAELDTLKTSCDGVVEQMVDAQHKLETVRALQTRLVPLVAELKALRTEIAGAQERIARVKHDEETVAAQEARYAELVEASRGVATDVAERTRQMQTLSEELARSTTIKDDLLVELDRVHSRQRDAIGQIQASEDQLAHAEKMFKQLEQRRSQVAFGEKKLAAVETRLAEMKQLAGELEKNIEAVASRERVVHAIKAEVEQVHQISARSKADLAHVIDSRAEISTLRVQVNELLSRIAETDERMLSIDGRRKVVDEVQTKANAIAHLLDDVRINLETLGEQKTVIDHVAEKASQLEFMLQEARNTLRTLQHERELAERIEEGIRKLRSQTTGAAAVEDVKRAGAA